MNARIPYERDHAMQAEMAADAEARAAAHDVAASRAAAAAIRAISDIDFTPAVAGQIAAVLSNRISECAWSHWPEAVSASEYLDSTVDVLTD